MSRYNSTFYRQMVIMAFLFVFVAASFGLVTVGLRQQIATSASRAVALERSLVELSRFDGRFTGEIAMAQSPAYLEAQNERFQLGLTPPRESQVVRVDSDTQIRFAERRWSQIVSVPEERAFRFQVSESN